MALSKTAHRRYVDFRTTRIVKLLVLFEHQQYVILEHSINHVLGLVMVKRRQLHNDLCLVAAAIDGALGLFHVYRLCIPQNLPRYVPHQVANPRYIAYLDLNRGLHTAVLRLVLVERPGLHVPLLFCSCWSPISRFQAFRSSIMCTLMRMLASTTRV